VAAAFFSELEAIKGGPPLAASATMGHSRGGGRRRLLSGLAPFFPGAAPISLLRRRPPPPERSSIPPQRSGCDCGCGCGGRRWRRRRLNFPLNFTRSPREKNGTTFRNKGRCCYSLLRVFVHFLRFTFCGAFSIILLMELRFIHLKNPILSIPLNL